jgi:hypothetical protein
MLMRYTITMATQFDGEQEDGTEGPLIIAGRVVRLVQFQNVDGTYPANAHEVTSNTWALCYSTSKRDKRGYIGAYLVGNVPEIHNEIDARQKATAWMIATPQDAADAVADLHAATAELLAESSPVQTSRRGRLAADQVAYLGMTKSERTDAWNGASIETRGRYLAAQIVRDSDEDGAWGMVTLTAVDPRRGITVNLDKLDRLMRHRDCDHATLNDTVMDICEMATDAQTDAVPCPYTSYGERCAKPASHDGGTHENADAETIGVNEPADDMEDRLTYMAETGATAEEIHAERLMSEAEIRANTRTLAATLHSQGAGNWTPEHCNHVPPMSGCWCALLDQGDDSMPSYPMNAHPVAIDNCEAGIYPAHNCEAEGVTRTACCGALLCSPHARQAAEERCPVCDSVMSAPLAAFDAAMASREIEIIEMASIPGPVTADVIVTSFRAGSRHELPIVPTWPRYGVMVEWWEDRDDAGNGGGKRAIIGSYDTWEVAAKEVDRLKRLGRFEYVHGIVALYGSDSDL